MQVLVFSPGKTACLLSVSRRFRVIMNWMWLSAEPLTESCVAFTLAWLHQVSETLNTSRARCTIGCEATYRLSITRYKLDARGQIKLCSKVRRNTTMKASDMAQACISTIHEASSNLELQLAHGVSAFRCLYYICILDLSIVKVAEGGQRSPLELDSSTHY